MGDRAQKPPHGGFCISGSKKSYAAGNAKRACERIDIWRLEEKQSDVALALHVFSDAVRNEVDQIVVVTNDTDFKPATQMIRRHTQTIIGLMPIFEEAKRVKRSVGAARKWLNQPCAHLDGRLPIDMCSADETAQELRKYMHQYAKQFGV